MSNSFRGLLISVEGLDSIDILTFIQSLSSALKKHCMSYVVYNYPVLDSPSGTLIEKISNTEEEIEIRELGALLALNHKESQDKVMNDLNLGKTVIMEHYIYTNIVFCIAKDSMFNIWKLYEGILLPDIVVYTPNKSNDQQSKVLDIIYKSLINNQENLLDSNRCKWVVTTDVLKVLDLILSSQIMNLNPKYRHYA